jgi:hypothetical protein
MHQATKKDFCFSGNPDSSAEREMNSQRIANAKEKEGEALDLLPLRNWKRLGN